MTKKSTSTIKSENSKSSNKTGKTKTKRYSAIKDVQKQLEQNQDYHEEFEVPKESRIMPDKINRFEYARILAERASQIEKGSPNLLSKEELEDCTSAKDIAKKEIVLRKCPFMIKRYYSNSRSIYELWSVNELILP